MQARKMGLAGLVAVLLATGGAMAGTYQLMAVQGAMVCGVSPSGSAMVGMTSDVNGNGWLWNVGTVSTFKLPGTSYVCLCGINDSGQIAGYGNYPGAGPGFSAGGQVGFTTSISNFGTTTPLNSPTPDSLAFGINNAGTALGSYFHFDNVCHGLISYPNGTYGTPTYPGSWQTMVSGMNSTGLTVGYYVDSGRKPHAWIRDTTGTFTSLDVGPLGTEAHGINDLGSIVGEEEDAVGQFHGFVRDPSGNVETVDFPGAVTTVVTGITSTGEIVGWCSMPDGTAEGFYSVPEPATLSLLALGGLAILRRRSGQALRRGSGLILRRRKSA